MRLFNKRQMQDGVQAKKTKNLGLNELSENTLLNVSGGQTYHSDDDKIANEKYIKELTKKPL